MRLYFPERIPLFGVMIFAVALWIVQTIEGTPLYFSAGCLLFLIIATLAFNTAGGLTRASGAYVFFYSVLVVVIGLVYKAYLGEPADSNLSDPRRTIEVYVAGISAMFFAAFLSRRFVRKTPLLKNVLKEEQMYRASIGCIIAGIVLSPIISLLGQGAERALTAFNQVNYLVPLGIIIGVMYEIRRSGGRRSVNLVIVGSMGYVFVFFGLLGFSKQGMLVAPVAWGITAWSQRYRFTYVQIACVLIGVVLFFRYLAPYAQAGRSLETEGEGFRQELKIASQLLEDPEKTRSDYIISTADARGLGSYFNTQQGFWERLQFISADDALINVTDQGKEFGLLPLESEALNVIPRVFWPEKPSINFGNVYAHEIGGMPDDDTTTGISFSPTAEAYHLAKWQGVLVIAPLLWFILFVVYDSLLGDVQQTPFGLLAVVLISHVAPEGGIGGVVGLLSFFIEAIGLCAIFVLWFAPIFADMVGRHRQKSPQIRLPVNPS